MISASRTRFTCATVTVVKVVGEWPASGKLFFAPVEPAEGYPRRPGSATFDTRGQFVASTWRDGDGLTPGSYRVRVECWRVPPTMGGPPEKSYLPPQYANPSASDLEVTVQPDSDPVTLEWDVATNQG